jgi:hypothetical protein
MERGSQRQESPSELPQEPALRSIPISVKATTRLRSGSGGVLFPSASGRARRSSDSTSSTGSLGGSSRGRSGSVVGQWVQTTLYLTETRIYYEALGQVSFLSLSLSLLLIYNVKVWWLFHRINCCTCSIRSHLLLLPCLGAA